MKKLFVTAWLGLAPWTEMAPPTARDKTSISHCSSQYDWSSQATLQYVNHSEEQHGCQALHLAERPGTSLSTVLHKWQACNDVQALHALCPNMRLYHVSAGYYML